MRLAESAFIPRRSPSPSSPTLATKVTVPGVCTSAVLHRARDRDEHGEATAVVANARPLSVPPSRDLHVGAFGKHRVEVRGDHEAGPRRLARTVAEHVAGAIHANVLQSELSGTRAAAVRRARASLNGGAGTSQKRICSSIVCGSLALRRLERRPHAGVLRERRDARGGLGCARTAGAQRAAPPRRVVARQIPTPTPPCTGTRHSEHRLRATRAPS